MLNNVEGVHSSHMEPISRATERHLTYRVTHLNDADADSNADSDVLVISDELLNLVFDRVVTVL